MRLKKFIVIGLFGLFDHEIPLRVEERITIIHAPNGYGKTVILKLISNFFGGSLRVYREVEFEKIEFWFDDDSVATITPRLPDQKAAASLHGSALYSISYKDVHGKQHKFDPWADPVKREADRFYSDLPRLIDRYVPYLVRTGPQRFRDIRTDEVFSSVFEVAEKYWLYFPDNVKDKSPHPQWLQELRDSVHCRLIETQRLMVNLKEKSTSGRRGLFYSRC